ncbi:DUF4395 domain-containing protein [Lactococcus cremoris]
MAKTTFQGIPRPLVRTNQTFIVLSIILAVVSNFYWILLLPILAGLSGILFERNFVILIAKRFLKRKASEYVLEDKSDLRFNQIIATSLLSASLIASLTIIHFGIVFAAFVFLAASIALSGFCVGCWIHFQLRQYQYRRQVKKGLH